ncbi:MAG: response regulator [Nevskiaceae bacterium]|nr:MAG: response regulator [Nevskiaceae bacterium]
MNDAEFNSAGAGRAVIGLPHFRPTVLLVDDEERILRSLAMLFRLQYEVRATTDAHEALRIVENERVHVIVSDQKMPIMRGADLLRQVKEKSPHTMRLLLTGYSELDAVVDSVNEGEIFRFLNKPWDANEIRSTVAQAAQIARASFDAPPAPVLEAPPQSAPSSQQLFTGTGSFVVPMASERILVLDDDAEVPRVVQELVGPSQPVLWARSLDEAFALLEREPVGVVVSELEVGGERLTGVLKALKAQHPEVVSIVLTPFQDIGTLVGLINEGQVFRLLPKPIRKGPLAMNLASALKHHRALKAAPKLAQRHVVQPVKAPEEASVAGRVMGFLARLRSRVPTA